STAILAILILAEGQSAAKEPYKGFCKDGYDSCRGVCENTIIDIGDAIKNCINNCQSNLEDCLIEYGGGSSKQGGGYPPGNPPIVKGEPHAPEPGGGVIQGGVIQPSTGNRPSEGVEAPNVPNGGMKESGGGSQSTGGTIERNSGG